MLRSAAICSVLLVTGCMTGAPDDEGDIPTGVDLLGRVCTTTLTVTGSFTQSLAPPVHDDGSPYTGCWPIGTWTFQAMPAQTDCAAQPSLLPQYQFRVEQALDADGNPYQTNQYMTDPSVRNRVKVSQGGDGLCEGELNLWSADGKE